MVSPPLVIDLCGRIERIHRTPADRIDPGKGPVLTEPVKAKVTVERTGGRVVLLDHDGLTTQKTIPISNGSFTIDGASDRTPYYLIRY